MARRIGPDSDLVIKEALFFVCFLLFLAIPHQPVAAQEEQGESQLLRGRINPDGVVFYEIPDRKEGETLYVLMEATSDNLDPFVGMLSAATDLDAWRANIAADIENIGRETDLVGAITALNDQYFLAWDDDSGPGYSAALTFSIPEDGDYYLFASASDAAIWEPVFGNYDLWLGVDDPRVLSGTAAGSATIAVRNDTLSPPNFGIETVSAMLSEEKQVLTLGLVDLQAGDTLNLVAQLQDPGLNAALFLLDFGGKPLAVVTSQAEQERLALTYTIPEDGGEYAVYLTGCCGEYNLTAGLNAPEVLDGQTGDQGTPVLETAIPVTVGFRLQQITGVDQKEENFGVVGTLRMEWDDPRLAFSAEECQCLRKVYTQRNFNSFYSELGDNWPDFTFFNQQGRRDIQNQEAVILPNGHVTYIERFSTTFQAAEFDFRKFPFDSQPFLIHIDGLWSEDLYAFEDNEAYTVLGNQLGEDEWPATDFEVMISREEASPGITTPRYTFRFEAERNVNFYILRIFVPILVVIIVSWITFFLKDYDKRVDVAAGNLLLFIAFNFTISDDLPRLGYLTFMDTILIGTFVITALVMVFNVALKRLEMSGREALAARLDLPMIWIYPLLYGAVLAVTYLYFFVWTA